MLFKNISIIDENFEYKEGIDLEIKDDRIVSIKPNGEMGAQDDVFDGSNYIMMPGFYNAHAHSPMSLMRGYGENLKLHDWLFTKIFPFEDHLTDEAVYYGTLLSVAESFRYGIVSTTDMYYFLDGMVKAALDCKCKINVSRALANPEGKPFESLPAVHEIRDTFKKYHGISDGKVLIDSSLHAEYTSNEDTAIRLAELTKELGVRMHVHVSETHFEHEECKERHEGRTPVKYLADSGLFDIPANAAHCVWVEDEDMDILAEKNVFVSTNPVSNLKLASGIADVKKMMDKGITVCLGTDSTSSNNNLSMFEEMKTMTLLAKMKNNDPSVMEPKEALKIATRNGALSQGREDCGLIKEGYKADLILLKKNSPNLYPVYDMVGNIVLSASDSDIYMTMVDGEIVYKDGELTTIDLDETVKGVNKSVAEILGKL